MSEKPRREIRMPKTLPSDPGQVIEAMFGDKSAAAPVAAPPADPMPAVPEPQKGRGGRPAPAAPVEKLATAFNFPMTAEEAALIERALKALPYRSRVAMVKDVLFKALRKAVDES